MSESATIVGARPRRRGIPVPRAETVAVALALVVVGWLVIVPLSYLAWRGFTQDGVPTLEHLRDVFATVGVGEVVAATLVFTLGSTLIGLVVGTGLAFAFVRTDLPLRRSLFMLALVPLLIPGVLMSLAWILLAAPRAGMLNGLVQPIAGPGAVDVFGLPGMTFVESLRLTPIAMLMVAGALQSLDPALEESAVVSGVGRWVVFRRVTLPLLRPVLAAAALLLVLLSVESFAVPVLLGLPGGVFVFTSVIWSSYQSSTGGLGVVASAGTVLMAVTVVGALLLAVVTRRRRSFETVGRNWRTGRRLALGRWRPVALVAVLGYLGAAVVLPLAALAWMSTQPYLAPVSTAAFGRASLDGYVAVLAPGLTRSALVHSVTYAVIAATLASLVALCVTWLSVRTDAPGRRLLDVLAFAPVAVPGLVFGVGMLVLYIRLPVPIYGTAVILVLAYATLYLPHAVRFQGAGMAQVRTELEEAATVSGVRRIPMLMRVTLPLVVPAVATAWIIVLLFSLHELAASLLLYSPGTDVIGVRLWELYEAGSFQELAALGIVTAIPALALGGLALAKSGVFGGRA